MSDDYQDVKPLGSKPAFKTDDKDITAGTSSEPNALKQGVQVGRKGYVKSVAVDSIESARPSDSEISGGQ